MGFMGEGDKIIAIDSHIDTVGIGSIDNWDADPYEGCLLYTSSQIVNIPYSCQILYIKSEIHQLLSES